MKANAIPRLLSSLVWIDSGIVASQHWLAALIIFWQNTLPANIRKWVFSWNKRDGITSVHGIHECLFTDSWWPLLFFHAINCFKTICFLRIRRKYSMTYSGNTRIPQNNACLIPHSVLEVVSRVLQAPHDLLIFIVSCLTLLWYCSWVIRTSSPSLVKFHWCLPIAQSPFLRRTLEIDIFVNNLKNNGFRAHITIKVE